MLGISDASGPGAEARPPSQASFAYRTIREEIFSARQMPGRRLRIGELAARLSVSPGAVREGLARLVAEQLVTTRDQRGFAVAPCTMADLEDLADLRCDVESRALRRAVERGDVDWEAEIVAAAHRLHAAGPCAAVEQMRFGAALISACGSPRLIRLCRHLGEHWGRYRAVAGCHDTSDTFHSIQAMVDHALARDGERLAEVFVGRIRSATRLVLDSLDGAPSSSPREPALSSDNRA